MGGDDLDRRVREITHARTRFADDLLDWTDHHSLHFVPTEEVERKAPPRRRKELKNGR